MKIFNFKLRYIFVFISILFFVEIVSAQDENIEYIITQAFNEKDSGNYYFSINLFENAINLTTNDTIAGKYYLEIGKIYIIVCEYMLAIESIRKAEVIFTKINDFENLSYCYENIAIAFYELRSYDKADEYLVKAIAICEENNLTNAQAKIYLSYAALSIYDNTQKSLKILKNAEKYLDNNDFENLAVLYYYYGMTAYYSQNYIEAKDNLLKALEFSEKTTDISMKALIWANLALNYGYLKDYKKTEEYALKSIETAEKIDDKLTALMGYDVLSRLYYLKNDIESYNYYETRYRLIQRDIYNAEQVQKISEVEGKYQLEKKDLEISLLEKSNKLNRNIIYFFIFVAVFSVILIFVLLSRNKYIKEASKNKEIANNEQQKRLEQEHKFEMEILQKELEFKNKELTNKALEASKKHELFNDILKEIVIIKKEVKPVTKRKLTKVASMLNSGLNTETWNEFSNYFKETHKDFTDKLDKTPDKLTKTEQKICRLIKLNMTTKEIASFTFTSTRTIEKHKSNIRKKFNLNSKIDLTDFITNL